MSKLLLKDVIRYACRTAIGPLLATEHIDSLVKKAFRARTEQLSRQTLAEQTASISALRRYQSLLTLCYPHPHYKEVTILGGKRIKVDIADIIGMSLYMGAPIPDIVELEIVRTLTPQQGTFLDVGANIGLYSLVAGIAVGQHGYVHSFEPVSTTHRILVENLSSNLPSACSTISCAAIGSTIGEVNIHVSEQSGLSSAVHNHKNRLVRTETVPIFTLDSYCKTHEIQSIDFLKIDVEGFESEVFLGAQQVLERTNPVLLVELIDEHLVSAGSSKQLVLDKLQRLGFSGWSINRDTRTLSRITHETKKRGVNYLFARETNPHMAQLTEWETLPITTRFTL
jgi:FkbM family methyltransferase